MAFTIGWKSNLRKAEGSPGRDNRNPEPEKVNRKEQERKKLNTAHRLMK
jgi:hypothetical protein